MYYQAVEVSAAMPNETSYCTVNGNFSLSRVVVAIEYELKCSNTFCRLGPFVHTAVIMTK